MEPAADKIALVKQWQAKINAMQGLGKISRDSAGAGFAPFAGAFPGNTFPTGAIHEFISYEPASAAATSGFISATTGKLMREGGICLWVAGERKVFPFGLKYFGLAPDRVVFINAPRPKEALWIIEEALKCEAITAVIGEVKELGFSDSKRLQLAVERSGVTGLIHRYRPVAENAVACTTRWKIRPLSGFSEDGLPGVGYPRWDVQLEKVRNGRPHTWQVCWSANGFTPLADADSITTLNERHTG